MRKSTVISCVITIGIMALIFFFSSQDSTKSTQTSQSVTRVIVDINPKTAKYSEEKKVALVEEINHYVRKTAHFSIYMLLGMSCFVSVWLLFSKGAIRTGLYALLVCVLYACTDEFHQGFVSGRGPMATDVLIDSGGACLGILIFVVTSLVLKRRKKC